ncbi:MAG TPA: hypothetical protein VK191_13770 [Symbiobacteriaceae bacterium]|nr:hypothetical protein [Symbiobacteriaceae bacterium]
MGHTVLGLFVHSDAADLAAALLRDEHNLTGDELDILTPSFAGDLPRPATDPAGNGLATQTINSYTGAANQMGDSDPVAKRWGDRVRAGDWAVVARANDGDEAESIARSLRECGAHRVDLLPH